MKVGVIGLGKLGLPLALVFSKAGIEVYGIDISEKRIQEINTYKFTNFSEPNVSEYLQKYGSNFKPTTDFRKLEDVPIVIIIPQTPSLENAYFNDEFVDRAVRDVHNVNENALLVISSNINTGTIDKLSEIHKKICYNPEFIKQGSIIADFENPKFTVIGAYNKEDSNLVTELWRKIHSKPIYVTKPIEAEIIKISLNVSYTLGMTFANIIGECCEQFNADAEKVLEVIYKDRRNYKPGLGFMGPCFPKDVNYFRALCLENELESGYKLSIMLNEMNRYIVEKYLKRIIALSKKKVGILGVAYKPNVPYIYESQPLEIANQLLKDGFEVFIFDPNAEEQARKNITHYNVHFCSTIEECLENAEVFFIGTANYSKINTSKPVINPWTWGFL